MKTIIITGASSGIGRAAAGLFRRNGWNVAATMRDPSGLEIPESGNFKKFRLDVADSISIKKAVREAEEQFGSIDVLLNNAGYAATGAFERSTEEQIRKQFEVNVFGLMKVARELIPHFRNNSSGLIINVSSIAGRFSMPLFSVYNSTKFAVEGFSEGLAYDLEKFGIGVKIIEPGPVKTDFYGRSMDLMEESGFDEYNNYVAKAFNSIQKFGDWGASPELVAKKIYLAATDGKKRLRYPVGGGAPIMLVLKRLLPDRIFMAFTAKILGI